MTEKAVKTLLVRMPVEVKEWLEKESDRNLSSQGSEVVRAVTTADGIRARRLWTPGAGSGELMSQDLNSAEDIAREIGAASVVIAVWMDGTSPLANEDGHCVLVIKGEKRFRRAIRAGKPDGRLVSFHVPDATVAENIRDLYGDMKRQVKGLH